MILRVRDERGTGILGSFFGAIVFLAFLALATHTFVGLYASSVVTAVAWDDARKVATDPGNADAQAAADADIRTRLSGFSDTTVEWKTNSTGDIGLSVGVKRPVLLPKPLVAAAGVDRIQRTVWVREERMR